MADVLTELAAKLNHKLALIDDRPGGVAGAVTPAEEVNLGDPVWNDPDFPDQDQPANPK